MSESENLEKLTDSELRAKCLQYGLPNVPVSATSRDLLIRKLRVTIDSPAKASPQKANKRRETIHVVTKASAETVSTKSDGSKREGSATNRRTIAAQKIESTEKEKPAAVVGPSKRRSVPREEPKVVKPTNIYPIIIESDDDDDNDDAALVKAVEQVEASNKRASSQQRGRRSVSLSKTNVVTTAYKPENAPPPIIEEKTVEIEKPKLVDQEKVKRYSTNVTRTMPSFAAEPKKTFIPTRLESHSANVSKPPSVSVANQKIYSEWNQNKLDVNRFSMGGRDSGKYLSYTGQKADNLYSPSSSNYRGTSSVSSTLLQSKPSSFYFNEFSDDTDTNDPVQSPYLSSFARSLELSRTGTSQLSRRHTRARINKNGDDNSIKELFIILDEKYHLMRYFIIFLLVLSFFVFLYVVFLV